MVALDCKCAKMSLCKYFLIHPRQAAIKLPSLHSQHRSNGITRLFGQSDLQSIFRLPEGYLAIAQQMDRLHLALIVW